MYRIISLVLYGCETLSLQLNEVYKRRAFERPKREEVTGWWSKLCNKELRDLYDLLNIVSVIKSRRG